jgi:hypothetical protein
MKPVAMAECEGQQRHRGLEGDIQARLQTIIALYAK